MAGDKTEKPTGKRLAKARKDGNIARTQEFGQWASLFVLTLVIGPLLAHEATRLQLLMASCLQAIDHPDPKVAADLLRSAGLQTVFTLVGLGTGVMVIGVAAAVAQGGLNFSTKSITRTSRSSTRSPGSRGPSAPTRCGRASRRCSRAPCSASSRTARSGRSCRSSAAA